MKPDSNVEAVRAKLLERSQRGIQKYGTDTERTDLTLCQWLQHAQEEALDLAVYLERLIRDTKERIELENVPQANVEPATGIAEALPEIICPKCGIVELTMAQYDKAMFDTFKPWECPKCGAVSEWNDYSDFSRRDDDC